MKLDDFLTMPEPEMLINVQRRHDAIWEYTEDLRDFEDTELLAHLYSMATAMCKYRNIAAYFTLSGDDIDQTKLYAEIILETLSDAFLLYRDAKPIPKEFEEFKEKIIDYLIRVYDEREWEAVGEDDNQQLIDKIEGFLTEARHERK